MMEIFYSNIDAHDSDIKKIELNIDITKDEQEIEHNNKIIQIKMINNRVFLLKKYFIHIILFILVELMFFYHYPIVALIYTISSILIYLLLQKRKLAENISTIIAISYMMHLLVFVAMYFTKGIFLNSSLLNYFVFGSLTVNIILMLLYLLNFYNKVFSIEIDASDNLWYIWQPSKKSGLI